MASQSLLSNRKLPNAHWTFSPFPAGPRYSRTAAFTALAVWAHVLASLSTVAPATEPLSQASVPVAVGHVASARFSMLACVAAARRKKKYA